MYKRSQTSSHYCDNSGSHDCQDSPLVMESSYVGKLVLERVSVVRGRACVQDRRGFPEGLSSGVRFHDLSAIEN